MAEHGTAIVIGASMAGLLAARALADTYPRVLVIERDTLPDEPAPRRGVPQGRQLHVLLARGLTALDELFPGIADELTALGAPMVDLQDDVHWYNDGYRMRRAPSGLIVAGITRPLLEACVRARVAALPAVGFRHRTELVGVESTVDRRRVTGVRVWSPDGTEHGIAADLVVDASGRGSRTPGWLSELGYRPPAEERVPIGVTYVTRVYEREAHHLEGLRGALTNAVPGAARTGIVAACENGGIAVALSGVLGEEPPTDDRGMVTFAESLPAPQIADLVRDAVPRTEAVKMRFPASVRRRYERLRRFPAGLLVVGDAVCSFNPLYGQGMTVAATQALLLRELLAEGTDDLARRFFRRAATLIDAPWQIAVGTDLRFPEVPGRRSLQVRFVNAYLHRLHRAATADPALGTAFLRVLNLIDPPTRLLAPGVLLRVLRGGVLRREPRRASGVEGGVSSSAGA